MHLLVGNGIYRGIKKSLFFKTQEFVARLYPVLDQHLFKIKVSMNIGSVVLKYSLTSFISKDFLPKKLTSIGSNVCLYLTKVIKSLASFSLYYFLCFILSSSFILRLSINILCLNSLLFYFFQTGFHCVTVLAVLELNL